MKNLLRLLPAVVALIAILLVTSCTPQKQYGCPNHLESGAAVN